MTVPFPEGQWVKMDTHVIDSNFVRFEYDLTMFT